MRKLFVTSPNIIRDKSFRRRLSRLPGGVGGGGGAGGAADEVFEVVRQALDGGEEEEEGNNKAVAEGRTVKEAVDADGNQIIVISAKTGITINCASTVCRTFQLLFLQMFRTVLLQPPAPTEISPGINLRLQIYKKKKRVFGFGTKLNVIALFHFLGEGKSVSERIFVRCRQGGSGAGLQRDG